MSAQPLRWVLLSLLLLALSTGLWAQSAAGTISGTVRDPSDAVVPGASLNLTNDATRETRSVTSSADGLFSFPNIPPGDYELKASATGFRDFVQSGISVLLNQVVRLDVRLQVGTATETVTVQENASPLDFETSTRQEGVSPKTINELPLLVSGAPRTSAQFAVLMQGVTTGGGNNAFDARINGGLQSGDEAVMDGVSMQQGTMSQTGMISMWDFRMTPDMISEFKVLTSNYEPQYGATTSANIIVTTRSGTNEFHGGGFEYFRDTELNARACGRASRGLDREHDFGGFVGGPAKVPKVLWSNWHKTYFYTNIEKMLIEGGVNQPTVSIPSLKQRAGDFSDWKDADGKLIPIYKPWSTRTINGQTVRDQFMGCDGTQPNVICSTDIPQNSLAKEWFKFLPNPINDQPLNNYQPPAPVPDSILADAIHYLFKIDQYFGDKDHVYFTIWHQRTPKKFASVLPQQLASESFSDPQNSWVNRFNWSHTFSPTVLNHFAFGYLDRFEGYGSVNAEFVNDLPKIPDVPNNQNYPPQISFSKGFAQYGSSTGLNGPNTTSRPAYVMNNLLTWVKGKHTLKFGGEYRNIGQNFRNNGNESGSFYFDHLTTGLLDVNSGSPIASFLLEHVASGSAAFRTVSTWYARADAWIWHVGDTWKVTPKLTLTLGVSWDMFRPTVEKWDRLSFFDPNGTNPSAGGRKGRLAFAGDQWGSASYGARRPEETFKKGYSPRVGIAYAIDDKTVIRTGYGIFYTQAFYPTWGGGMNLDGFNNDVSFSSTEGGLERAFILREGFPQNFQRPPFLDAGYRNGQGTMYRPIEANRLSYSQQWNLSLERQLQQDLMVSLAYVGNKGTRLPSQIAALNALEPKYLSMGAELRDDFEPGQASLHGVPLPYEGWVEQMTGCAPSVAQALLPFPQYCSSLTGLNENAGNSTFHSFQLKVEKRFSEGMYLLGSYTLSKLLTTSGHVDEVANTWSGIAGAISPFERQRNKSLAQDDVPHTLSLAWVYEFPFGQGKRWRSSSGVANGIIGGWSLSGTARLSSGVPLFFRSGQCNLPGEFRLQCIPGILPGANIFAQSKDNYDPGKGPLFNKNAFEPIEAFNYYYGVGSRIENVRGFGYKNLDVAVFKKTRITEQVMFELRFEFFNVMNLHNFTSSGVNATQPFSNNLAAADFGQWNGGVTNPRNIQLGARITF